jgi:hypothetical protein
MEIAKRRGLLLLGLCGLAEAAVRRKDREALFWLYENLGGAQWTRNVGWAAEGNPCAMNARWVGVGCLDPCDTWRDGPDCTAGRVTAIYLSENRLSGGLGNWSSSGVLTNLSFFDLSFNNLSGTLPTQLGKISNLQSLQLQHNSLSGSLPSQLGEINGAGALPTWSYHMQSITSRLEDVQLQNNSLSGALPSELGSHTALKQLNLQHDSWWRGLLASPSTPPKPGGEMAQAAPTRPRAGSSAGRLASAGAPDDEPSLAMVPGTTT